MIIMLYWKLVWNPTIADCATHLITSESAQLLLLLHLFLMQQQQ